MPSNWAASRYHLTRRLAVRGGKGHGINNAVKPNFWEVNSSNGAGPGVVIGDLALDHFLVFGRYLAGEVEAEVCLALEDDSDRASVYGLIDLSPTGRLAGTQRHYCCQGQPGCSDPPGHAPAG